jgi:hypothetical protein
MDSGIQPQPRSGDTSPEPRIMSHAYSRLHYHLVFSTKERKRLIVPEIKDRL